MKSYFANSFRVAMEQARKELGPDAMLVTTRASALESRHMGEYEVVFAAELPLEEAGAASASGSGTNLTTMLAEMRRQLKQPQRPTAPSVEGPARNTSQLQPSDLLSELLQRDVAPDIARRLMTAAENRVRPASASRGAESLRSALAEEIRNAFQVDSRLEPRRRDGSTIIVALVGPPGAGKTATLAKLAVRHGLTARRPAVLISLDTLRVGASEQLRCYASLLGLGFHSVETNRALEQAIEENRNKELIFIDTPGFTLSDLTVCDAADFLSRRTDIQKHLVLPASMRYADMARLSAAYQVFKPSRSIFTRMDETESFGAVLSEAIAGNRPVAFFCDGQRVPEDLKEASQRSLTDLLLPSTEPPSTPVSVNRPIDTLQTAA